MEKGCHQKLPGRLDMLMITAMTKTGLTIQGELKNAESLAKRCRSLHY